MGTWLSVWLMNHYYHQHHCNRVISIIYMVVIAIDIIHAKIINIQEIIFSHTPYYHQYQSLWPLPVSSICSLLSTLLSSYRHKGDCHVNWSSSSSSSTSLPLLLSLSLSNKISALGYHINKKHYWSLTTIIRSSSLFMTLWVHVALCLLTGQW